MTMRAGRGYERNMGEVQKQIPGMWQGLAPDRTSRVCVVGDAGNHTRAEELRRVKLRSQLGVALEPDPP